jgi:hypothetical protein
VAIETYGVLGVKDQQEVPASSVIPLIGSVKDAVIASEVISI